MSEHRIAVIAGDGIGREVMPEGVRVLEAAAARHNLRLQFQEFPWNCDWYKVHGEAERHAERDGGDGKDCAALE